MVDYSLIAVFTMAGLAGTFAGSRLNQRLSVQKIQKIFAWFVVVLAKFIWADNIHKLLLIINTFANFDFTLLDRHMWGFSANLPPPHM